MWVESHQVYPSETLLVLSAVRFFAADHISISSCFLDSLISCLFHNVSNIVCPQTFCLRYQKGGKKIFTFNKQRMETLFRMHWCEVEVEGVLRGSTLSGPDMPEPPSPLQVGAGVWILVMMGDLISDLLHLYISNSEMELCGHKYMDSWAQPNHSATKVPIFGIQQKN